MSVRAKLDALWPRMEPLLTPDDGSASQLYVLDLPVSAAAGCIGAFECAVEDLCVTTLNGRTFGIDQKQPLDDDARQTMLSTVGTGGRHILRGILCDDRSVDFWIEPTGDNLAFDAQLVFWADRFFPTGQSSAENAKALEPLLTLAETFRKDHPDCDCVLSASEAHDPRDGRGAPWAVFW